MKNQKYYGRKDVNKLDWIFAIVWAVIALATIRLSIGLAVEKAGGATIPAFLDVVHGLAFLWSPKFGPVALIVINSILFYGSLIYMILAIIYLCKKKRKDRIPGAVATFTAVLGFIVFLSLIYELALGNKINGVWTYGSIFFLVCLAVLIYFSVYATLSNYNISLEPKEPEVKVVVKEVIKEVVKEVPVVEERKEEKAKAPVKEEKPAEEKVGFNGLGPRRRRIPFESKLKKADHATYARYSAIVEAAKAFKVSARLSIPGETFSYKKGKLLFLTFSGKTLKAYIALDPKEFVNSPIPVKDVSSIKKFEETPSLLAVKSDLAARRVVELLQHAFRDHKVPKK